MESARKPQLNDLRQKRLAYFEQRYSPSPPSEPKPSSSAGFVSKRMPIGSVESKNLGVQVATQSKTGAIQKSYKKGRQCVQEFDVHVDRGNSLVSPSRSHKMNSAQSNQFSYQLVADKKKSTNQRLSAQEFEIHVANDVEELFQSSRARSKTPSKDKTYKVPPAAPFQDNLEASSMDYEQQLIDHLQRPDRYNVNDQIKKEQIPSSNARGTKEEDKQQRNYMYIDSRKKHLKKFLYKQDEETTSAVKAASDHNALHAENILHQMGQVRKLRAQVHGELMSGFSGQKLMLNPKKSGSEGRGLSSEEECRSMFALRSSTLDGYHLHPLEELQHSSSAAALHAAQMSSLVGPKLISPSGNHSAIHSEKEDNGHNYPNVQDECDGDDDLDNGMTFDLGALQEAAKRGDDILRKYIQSLSKNLKKKKQNESVMLSQDVFEQDQGGKKLDEEQYLESGMPSSLARNPKNLYREPSDEQDTRVAEMHESETQRKSIHREERPYRPKVSQPTVISMKLETLGLFNDLTSKRLQSSDHHSGSLHTLSELGPGQTKHLNWKVEGNSSDDDNLGLSTHRPQQRLMSPLKQVYMHSEKRHTQSQEEQVCNLSGDESTDLVQKHQYYLENSLSDLVEPGLSTDDGDCKQYQAIDNVNFHSMRKGGEVNTDDADYLFSVDSYNAQYALENQMSSNEQSGAEEKRKPHPGYDQLFSNQKCINKDSVPFPLPSGTEIGNFVCSEQSTDSDVDRSTSQNLVTSSQLIPNPPQEEKQSSVTTKPQKPKPQVPTRNKTPRRPKTPDERHVDGVREHHERDRETRRQLSSRKSKSQETEDDCSSGKQSTSPSLGSSTHEEINKPSVPSEKEDGSQSNDILKLHVEDIFKTSLNQQSSGKPLDVGPSGDAHRRAKHCLDCNRFTADNSPDVCGADIQMAHLNPVNREIPPFDAHVIDLLSGGDAMARTHLTTGSAWDIQVSAQRQDKNIPRKGDDDESTVMGKIANFVPKLASSGGGDFVNKLDFNGGQTLNRPLPLDEVGAGEASNLFGDLPNRVDAWLTANETGQLSQELNSSGSANHELPHLDQLLRPDQLHVEVHVDHKVTFDLPSQANLNKHYVHQNGHIGFEEHLAKMKPRPSSAGPQRSRQGATRPKSAISRSKTGQLIDSPMYNRHWETSRSMWGSRRSAGDTLKVAGQRSSVLESIPASGSPAMQRKRPLSAKSANRKSRESKDSSGRGRATNLKEEFLMVNVAQVEEGLSSKALNSSHTILPLTLQLICDSPRGGDGLSIWELLPDEILLHIFAHLSYKDLIQCAACCSRFHRIAVDDTLWRTIKLHKRQLSDFSLTQIGERHPVSLSLTQCHGNIVTENGLRNLFRCCADTLQELNVSGCTGGELTGDSLLLHASRCQHLISLDASWCQATDNGLSAISDSCQRLTSLCLNGCQSVSDECLNRVIRKHSKSLRVLEVLGCLQLSPDTLRLIGSECCHLHTLNIGQCYKVTDDCISHLVSHLRNLKHLDLRGCKQIRDNCVRKIVRHCKRLDTLVLANCFHITNAAIVEIAAYLPTLRSLDVSGCKKVNNEGTRSLATCCHYLMCLDVSSTGVTNKSVSALANYCNKTLVSVRFNCCKDITETAIVKLLKNCKKLTMLHLYGVKGLRNLGVLKLQYPCLQFE